MRDIRRLALDIGPRLATGPNFKRAANLVARRFEGLGFAVTRQDIDVPAGNSWGVAVRAGRSQNIIARSKDFDPSQDYVLVGAHLDTVAVAPGAEDNASGISVLLESARVIGASKRQIVFVAFGAEEPVGTGEALHHFGSTEYVARMTRTERAHLTGMVALDRVSVGTVVPLCTGGISPTTIRDQLERIAGRLKIPTSVCDNNAASDHWSFEQVGFPVARIGSTPYFGYHSIHDLPEVVNPAQLQRVGRLVTAWLRGD